MNAGRFFVTILTATAPLLAPFAVHAQLPAPATLPLDSLERWLSRVNNTGRWGADDEMGTLNLITPEMRRQAAATVRDGITVSLAHEIVPGPNPRAGAAISLAYGLARFDSVVTWGFDSTIVMFHGWAYSHIDALSHTAWRGRMYNGATTAQAERSGTRRLGVQNMGSGIVTRGVLIDIPGMKGVPYLEPGTLITVADLERWERENGISVGTGDVVLIRTGRWAREAALGSWDVTRGAAGPHPSVALWLHQRGVAAMGGDVSNEYYPSVVPGISDPLHELALVGMGMPLMDNLDFEEAARTAERGNRWTFLFMAAPLRMRGGSGSLLNPLAIF